MISEEDVHHTPASSADEFERKLMRLQNILPKLQEVFKENTNFLTDLLSFFEMIVEERISADFLPYNMFLDAAALSTAKIRQYSPRRPSDYSVLFFGEQNDQDRLVPAQC